MSTQRESLIGRVAAMVDRRAILPQVGTVTAWDTTAASIQVAIGDATVSPVAVSTGVLGDIGASPIGKRVLLHPTRGAGWVLTDVVTTQAQTILATGTAEMPPSAAWRIQRTEHPAVGPWLIGDTLDHDAEWWGFQGGWPSADGAALYSEHCIWRFPLAATIPAGATLRSLSLRLTWHPAYSAYGSTPRPPLIRAVAATDTPPAASVGPVWATDPLDVAPQPLGSTITYRLPTEWAIALLAGTYGGIGIGGSTRVADFMAIARDGTLAMVAEWTTPLTIGG